MNDTSAGQSTTGVSVPSYPPPCSEDHVRIALIGDVVGKPGMSMACEAVPQLRNEFAISGLIVNAENAADGSGLRCKDYRRLIDAGYDGITLGDHLYKKREIIEMLETQANIIRPCNLPASAPGRTHMVLTIAKDVEVVVLCALGRVFMKPIDCPFQALDSELDLVSSASKIRLVDFHAEATSDMQTMGWHLDGRVSAVLGTHTHVTTADEQVLPQGTGFQCDVGMTGAFDSVLGRKKESVLAATIHAVPVPFAVATGSVRLHGTWFDVARATGHCQRIGRIVILKSGS